MFYAAGNVRAFAEPSEARGVTLVSAWQVNAIPVAEMCLSQVLLSLRGYFRAVRGYREVRTFAAKAFHRTGVNGETVGMIGMGKIGTRLRELLAPYPLRVIAHDPFLTAARAAELDVERVSLDEVFSRTLVVEADLVDVLRSRPDLTALVDVTWPEPPPPDSPMWSLPNLVISPHIGGTIGDEVVRLADLAIAEFESWVAGRPLRHQVTAEILATMC